MFADLGVSQVRLTGGEPLLRRQLPKLVELIAKTGRIDDLALTTNGLRLKASAEDLRSAGLHRVTVSLDTLHAERFRSMTGRDGLAQVLAGIDAAARLGLRPLKLDTVLIIAANSQPFCGTFDRSRVTADGMWYNCLHAPAGLHLTPELRADPSDDELRRLMALRWRERTDCGAEQLQRAASLSATDHLCGGPAAAHRRMHTRGG